MIDPTVKMTSTKKEVANDDGMRSSANALTEKLYQTVLDVFGNYAGNDEDDYNNMLEALRNKRMQKPKSTARAKSDDNRGEIAKKLLEGYLIDGDVCDKCVMPLMSHGGQVSCVVCEKEEEEKKAACVPAMTKSLSGDSQLVVASTSESDLLEGEDRVNKELSQFNEKRFEATQAYTEKILGGYKLQDQLCSKCDMPMMEFKDSVDCVFCPQNVKKETLDLIKITPNEVKEVTNNEVAAVTKAAGAPKPVKELSQAEIMAERVTLGLRGGSQSKDHGENTESELEKAESELMNMIIALGMGGKQDGEVSEALQDYFSKKKTDRAAGKRLKEAEDGIIEAEVIAAAEEHKNPGILQAEPEPVVATFVCEEENGVFVENGTPIVPATPKFEPLISCSISDSFRGLKGMFASTSHPVRVGSVAKMANRCDDSHLEAKNRIATLVAEGWEVSADSCPQCELPLFSNSNGRANNGLQRCVTCGPIPINGNITQGDSFNILDANKEAHQDVTTEMVNRVMEGWIIAEGKQCPSCYMPAMISPQTRLTHCIACEMGGHPTHPAMNARQHKLRIEIAPESTYNKLPDPTTSMYELQGQYVRKPVDPIPSMQVPQSKLNVGTKPEPIDLTMGEPTPTVKTLRFKLNEPEYEPVVQHIMGEPTPAAKTLRFKLNEPTPNMQAVRTRVNVTSPYDP